MTPDDDGGQAGPGRKATRPSAPWGRRIDRRRRVLLLTATVHPASDVPNLLVRDPRERAAEYAEVLRWAVAETGGAFETVVFAENSGADLGSIRAAVGGRGDVEFLSLPGRSEASAGRAYLETQLVSEAFGSSTRLSAPDTVVWKLTGRYRLANIGRIVRRAPPSHDLYFNLRRFPRPFADMYCYGLNVDGLRLLRSFLPELREVSGAPEVTLFRLLLEARGRSAAVSLRFAAEPSLIGRRGYNGVAYGDRREQALRAASTIARSVAPWVWL